MTSEQTATTEPSGRANQLAYATKTCVALLLMIVVFFDVYFAELFGIDQAARAIPSSVIVVSCGLALFTRTRNWGVVAATAAVSAGAVRIFFESTM